MTALSLPTTPARIRSLPVDKHGRPVPWFVAWVDGVPDFRVIAPGRVDDAVRFERCWVCGGHRGRTVAFVIGPMCAVNRVSAEPPSHVDCADYSAQACPFLTTPRMRRRESALPDGVRPAPGQMISRNPGVALVWVTRAFERFAVDDGYLFHVGDPVAVRWYAEGRAATRAEVERSIDSGLPLLAEEASAEGPEALVELGRLHQRALALLPP